jgi:hypothetical protein
MASGNLGPQISKFSMGIFVPRPQITKQNALRLVLR